MSKPDGGRAFPGKGFEGPDEVYYHGMSVRDYFAGQYITGRASRPGGLDTFQDAAKAAYEMADALLEERAK